jgi:hypothetical protein
LELLPIQQRFWRRSHESGGGPGFGPIECNDLFRLAEHPERIRWMPYKSGVEIFRANCARPRFSGQFVVRASPPALPECLSGALCPSNVQTPGCGRPRPHFGWSTGEDARFTMCLYAAMESIRPISGMRFLTPEFGFLTSSNPTTNTNPALSERGIFRLP